MDLRRLRYFLVVLPAVVMPISIGCANRPRPTYASRQLLPIAPRSEQADILWEAVRTTLRRHHFTLDRVDRRAGLITTKPASSQHFFEFWRRDVATWSDFCEATINPMRRWIEIKLVPPDGGAGIQLTVAVHKQRLSTPDRQFNSAGAAYQFFGDSLPSTTGKPQLTSADDRWSPQGTDAAMEHHILNAVLKLFADPIGTATPSGD